MLYKSKDFFECLEDYLTFLHDCECRLEDERVSASPCLLIEESDLHNCQTAYNWLQTKASEYLSGSEKGELCTACHEANRLISRYKDNPQNVKSLREFENAVWSAGVAVNKILNVIVSQEHSKAAEPQPAEPHDLIEYPSGKRKGVRISEKGLLDKSSILTSDEDRKQKVNNAEGIPIVNKDALEVKYLNQTFTVSDRQADILSYLLENKNCWIQGKELKSYDTERVDQIIRRLDLKIRDLIESHTRNGYKINL